MLNITALIAFFVTHSEESSVDVCSVCATGVAKSEEDLGGNGVLWTATLEVFCLDTEYYFD